MVTIPELLREHVSLDLECVDRVHINGYIPALQSSGGLGYFLEHQRGQRIASPILLGEITQSFAAQVEAFAKQESIPIVHFQKAQRKDDVLERPFFHLSYALEGKMKEYGLEKSDRNGDRGHNIIKA